MIPISISNLIYDVCPQFVSVQFECEVKNTNFSPSLWLDIESFINNYAQNNQIKDINKFAPILATRNIYKKLGKEIGRSHV